MQPVRAVFLSDAHLGAPEDGHYRRMLAFLESLRGWTHLTDLFILGDFFAYWMGFSSVPARYRPVLEHLQALVDHGVRLHYVEGNHDMDVGRYFARHLRADVHPERTEVTISGRRLLLLHGDTVDRADRGYRALRAFLRCPPMKGLSRALSPETVLRVADRWTLHKTGRVYAASHLPDLMERYARERWREGYDGVVMGHCHKPAYVTDTWDGRPVFYANLGDWIQEFTYLTVGPEGVALRRFEPLEARDARQDAGMNPSRTL